MNGEKLPEFIRAFMAFVPLNVHAFYGILVVTGDTFDGTYEGYHYTSPGEVTQHMVDQAVPLGVNRFIVEYGLNMEDEGKRQVGIIIKDPSEHNAKLFVHTIARELKPVTNHIQPIVITDGHVWHELTSDLRGNLY